MTGASGETALKALGVCMWLLLLAVTASSACHVPFLALENSGTRCMLNGMPCYMWTTMTNWQHAIGQSHSAGKTVRQDEADPAPLV